MKLFKLMKKMREINLRSEKEKKDKTKKIINIRMKKIEFNWCTFFILVLDTREWTAILTST